MRDSITISGKTYELATNAYTPIAYKEQFGKDYFQDLFSMVSTQSILDKIEHLNEEEKLETGDIDLSILTNFDMTFFHRIFWVFAIPISAIERVEIIPNGGGILYGDGGVSSSRSSNYLNEHA